jgi:putative nucleotidyltransferase with HDIG domain
MLRTRVRAGTVSGLVMSLVFAAVLALVQRSDTLVPAFTPRAGEAAPVTLRVPYAPVVMKSSRVGIAYGHGRIVIPRGTVLDPVLDAHRVALAFESGRREGRPLARFGAVFGIYFALFFLTSTNLRRFGNARTRLLRTQLGLFTAMSALVVLAKVLLLFTPLPELWIPLATVPMWVAVSLDRRTAFLVNVVMAFMASSLLLFDLPLLTVLITRGLASSVFFRNKKRPWSMLPAGIGAGVVACGIYAAVRVVFEGSFSVLEDAMDPLASPLLACVGGGALAGLLGAVLQRAGARLLGAVSRDRLIDLTDLEQPLLQKMAAEAPGSWEHARAMANLAEAAAAAIGADTLLTRVGAYYHDLGKTLQAKYFVENLLPNERSPHEDLDPDVSADAIMAHVVQGTKILREGGVPEPVVEFAYTHHGTQTIEFFWHKCLEKGNPKNLKEDFFRYPGMKPQTKETAILMLVDSIEAASRTIQPPEREKFETMIQRVVFTKLKSGQLDESGLTLEDVRTITSRMSDTLVSMYHGRIKYPWQRESRESMAKIGKPN